MLDYRCPICDKKYPAQLLDTRGAVYFVTPTKQVGILTEKEPCIDCQPLFKEEMDKVQEEINKRVKEKRKLKINGV